MHIVRRCRRSFLVFILEQLRDTTVFLLKTRMESGSNLNHFSVFLRVAVADQRPAASRSAAQPATAELDAAAAAAFHHRTFENVQIDNEMEGC